VPDDDPWDPLPEPPALLPLPEPVPELPLELLVSMLPELPLVPLPRPLEPPPELLPFSGVPPKLELVPPEPPPPHAISPSAPPRATLASDRLQGAFMFSPSSLVTHFTAYCERRKKTFYIFVSRIYRAGWQITVRRMDQGCAFAAIIHKKRVP
jgi:hypothetical protein